MAETREQALEAVVLTELRRFQWGTFTPLEERVAAMERALALPAGAASPSGARGDGCWHGDKAHPCALDDVERLRGIILRAGLWRAPPCCLCGYMGPGYFQPESHACAAAPPPPGTAPTHTKE